MICKECGKDSSPLKKTCSNCGAFLEGRTINNVTGKSGYRTADGDFVPDKQENEMKDNIIDFEENIPHEVSEVICINCKKRWIAVRPTVTLLKDIDCPGCNKTGYVIETGQKINEETKPCMI